MVSAPIIPDREGRLVRLSLCLPILSGLFLMLLFPLVWSGAVGSWQFQLSFGMHLLLQFAALGAMLRLFLLLLPEGRVRFVILGGAAFLFLWIALLALLPITSRDALIHHLVVPRWWLEAGEMVRIPWHDWSHYPMLVQLGFLGFQHLELELLTPLYHGSFLILAAGAVLAFTYLQTRSRGLALLASLFTALLPIFLRLAAEPMVDLALALYSFLAFALMVWRSGDPENAPGTYLIGAALGLAAGTKYNGLLFAGIAGIFWILLCMRSRRGFLLSSCSIGIWLLVVLSPWLVRNFAWTDNPIYPLFHSHFDRGPVPEESTGGGLSNLQIRTAVYGEDETDLILLPFRMLMFGEDDSPRFFDGVAGPLYLLCFIPLFSGRRRSWYLPTGILLFSYFGLAIVLSGARLRYMMPILPIVTLLTAFGAVRFGELLSRRWSWQIASFLAAGQLCLSVLYLADLSGKREMIQFYTGGAERSEYLSKMVSEYDIAQYLNENLPSDSRTYLLFTGNRYHLYKVPVINSGYRSELLLLKWIRESPNRRALRKEFAFQDITHLLVHAPRFAKSFQNYLRDETLTVKKVEMWNRFVEKRAVLVHQEGPYQLWELKQ